MEKIMFGEIFSFVPAPKIKAEKGRNRGKYPLYTTGQQFPQRTDQSMFNGPALIISKTVPVSIYYCNGSFSASYNPQIEMFARFKMKSSFHKTKRII